MSMSKKNKTSKLRDTLILLLMVITVLLVTRIADQKSNIDLEKSVVTLSKCTDGDTAHFMIDGKDETVRLLAIDTPETVKPGTPVQPYGKEASNYTCKTLKNAEEIILEYEASNKTDKYDRKLAWVFADNQLLQAKLIEQGFAKVDYIYGDYKYTGELQALEEIAKSAKIGIWLEK